MLAEHSDGSCRGVRRRRELQWRHEPVPLDGDGLIYNLDTTALGLIVGQCYRLDVYIGGTSAIRASASIYALFKPVK